MSALKHWTSIIQSPLALLQSGSRGLQVTGNSSSVRKCEEKVKLVIMYENWFPQLVSCIPTLTNNVEHDWFIREAVPG